MAKPKPCPAARPPAWLVTVDGHLRWVAMGPYGLLRMSYGAPGLARAAAVDAFDEMWATQSLRNKDALENLRVERTFSLDVPYLPEDTRAALVDGGSPNEFVVLHSVDFSTVGSRTYKDVSEVINVFGPPSDPSPP